VLLSGPQGRGANHRLIDGLIEAGTPIHPAQPWQPWQALDLGVGACPEVAVVGARYDARSHSERGCLLHFEHLRPRSGIVEMGVSGHISSKGVRGEEMKANIVDGLMVTESEATVLKLTLHLLILLFADFTFCVSLFND
jgi:hypothetical protein